MTIMNNFWGAGKFFVFGFKGYFCLNFLFKEYVLYIKGIVLKIKWLAVKVFFFRIITNENESS